MCKELKTAAEWESYFYPELIIYNHHGFGSSYTHGPNEEYFEKQITFEEFEQKLMHCTVRMPKDLAKLRLTKVAGESND